MDACLLSRIGDLRRNGELQRFAADARDEGFGGFWFWRQPASESAATGAIHASAADWMLGASSRSTADGFVRRELTRCRCEMARSVSLDSDQCTEAREQGRSAASPLEAADLFAG